MRTMPTMRNIIAFNVSLLLTALSCIPSDAQIVALDSGYDANSYVPQPANTTYGWRFDVGPSAISVTHLGYFDHAQNGLSESHQVGIWEGDGDLVAQAVVASSDSLVGNFRFTLISSVTLQPNTRYFIGADSAGGLDNVIAGAGGAAPVLASEISAIQATLSNGSGFSAPLSDAALNHGVVGPNFQFTPVPEPHEYALVMGLGLAGFYCVRRRLAKGNPKECAA
jgi:hypothetical protein